MAKLKNKPAPLRNFGKELGDISGQSALVFDQRTGQLVPATTQNLTTILGALTSGRSDEVSANRRLLQGTALKRANRAVRRFTRNLTQPTPLSAPITEAAQTALTDPTAGNTVLGQLIARGGRSALLDELESQALRDLRDDGQLSPEEERLATQGARAAFADRGLATSSPAALAEVLNRDQYVKARQDRARQFGAGVEQLGQGRELGVASLAQHAIDAGRNFALGANQQEMARDAWALGAKTAAQQFRLQTDPGLIAYQTPSMLPGALSSSLALTEQADVFPALLQYGNDVYNTNFNALEARYIAEMNRRAALQGAGMQAAGTTQAGKDAMTGNLIGAGVGIGVAGGLMLF